MAMNRPQLMQVDLINKYTNEYQECFLGVKAAGAQG
jgi:hypothetical protein